MDLRLSQLAPTDLRGLPVAEDGRSTWYPPNFLPQDGKGILFLDEINMAPPAMQGVAQQLILDRRIGDYVVPEDWYVWAAGNRKIDRAAVFDMPSALANRFLHYEVEPDITAFKDWALRSGLHEEIVGFLLFRPTLLHKYKPNQLAWPSPRSWRMADVLHKAALSTAPAVGDAAAGEFEAYCKIVKKIPDLDRILSGQSKVKFPAEPSARYAVVLGLAKRATTPTKVKHALKWLREKAGGEWVQFFVSDVFTLFRARGRPRHFVEKAQCGCRVERDGEAASGRHADVRHEIVSMAEELRKKVSTSILRIRTANPFFGALALFADVKISDTIESAATNGKEILFNKAYCDQLSSSELTGVLLHEILHCALEHITRWGRAMPRPGTSPPTLLSMA